MIDIEYHWLRLISWLSAWAWIIFLRVSFLLAKRGSTKEPELVAELEAAVEEGIAIFRLEADALLDQSLDDYRVYMTKSARFIKKHFTESS